MGVAQPAAPAANHLTHHLAAGLGGLGQAAEALKRPRVSDGMVTGGNMGSGLYGVLNQGDQIDTIAILSLREKGLTEEYLRTEFSQIPGFIKMQFDERIGGCFIKFESPLHAEAALQAANTMQMGAEWARRN